MGMMLTLYSTDSCQLCDRAFQMLRSMPELRNIELDVVDIALDECLMERYGTRIPVLRSDDAELDWPFNADEVLALIQY